METESYIPTTPSHDQLTQELQPQVNAIVKMAELLKSTVPDDETAQRISAAARVLLDVISRHSAEPPDGRADAESNDKCDVLYIEDDRRTFGSVKLLLEVQRGLKILQAANGETGFLLAQASSPGLILLDLDLPDIHGSEVIQRLQKEPSTSKIPVIVVSGDATPSHIERLLVLGARNYLTKPIRAQPFLAVIDEVLPQKAK